MRECKCCGVWLNYIAHGKDAEYCSAKCESLGDGVLFSSEKVDPTGLIGRIEQLERQLSEQLDKNKELTKALTPKITPQYILKSISEDLSLCSKLKNKIKESGCSACSYKKCLSALEFHHIDTKGSSLSVIKTVNHLLFEIETHKVVVLCANCHRELHRGVLDIELEGSVVEIETVNRFIRSLRKT